MTSTPTSLPSPSKPRPAARTDALYSPGLSVFYGQADVSRLAHAWFLRALQRGRRAGPGQDRGVLFLDGANRFDPLLVARFARRTGREPRWFNERIRVARAFTCFQLTELIVRAPRMLTLTKNTSATTEKFPAGLVVLTALPELYYDEDVREAEAAASFRRALIALREFAAVNPGAPPEASLAVGVFTDAPSFITPRRRFFRQLAAQAHRVWQIWRREDGTPVFRPVRRPFLMPQRHTRPLRPV
ncbi:MAG TPA: hypothetical protein VGA40_00290 [Candidatus Acidoferrales bacterium]